MKKLNYFIKTAIIGGFTIILPVALLYFIFKWLFKLVTNLIQPLTNVFLAKSSIPEIAADIFVILIILASCFLIGIVVKTKVGQFIHVSLEENILKLAPGYSIIKETVMQFLGKSKPPFSSVAIVRPFENGTQCTAFVTDEHSDGSYTVFIPTAPNPTSGFICHLDQKYVTIVDVTIERAMRSIISCGAGSEQVLKK